MNKLKYLCGDGLVSVLKNVQLDLGDGSQPLAARRVNTSEPRPQFLYSANVQRITCIATSGSCLVTTTRNFFVSSVAMLRTQLRRRPGINERREQEFAAKLRVREGMPRWSMRVRIAHPLSLLACIRVSTAFLL
eukprot:1184402-Rhodomonas_salina.1